MIELARDYARGADLDVLRLPTRLPTGADGALPEADAGVSTGHVLNYLDIENACGRRNVTIGCFRSSSVVLPDIEAGRRCAHKLERLHVAAGRKFAQ